MLSFISHLFSKEELRKAGVEEDEETTASGHYADIHSVSQDGGENEDGVKGAMNQMPTTKELNAAESLVVRAAKLRLLASEPAFGAVTPTFGIYAARNCSEDPAYPQWEIFDVKTQAAQGSKWNTLAGAVEFMQLLEGQRNALQANYQETHLSIQAGIARFSTVPG
jgi:hypothetical protein